jgi:hypothetical protein
MTAAGWLGAGCAAPSPSTIAPKPGTGIAEYRQIARAAHQAVADTVKSLDGLPFSPTQASARPLALGSFDKSLHQLERTSVTARARAEAIIARGQAYFDEWQGNLSSITNQTAAKAEAERFARLFERFDRVRQRSAELREEFRPFMGKLREFRARLDRTPAGASGESLQQERDVAVRSGGRVLKTLESISATLDEAETELQATVAAKR